MVFIELQGTGEAGDFQLAELNAMIELARTGITELLTVQQLALNTLTKIFYLSVSWSNAGLSESIPGIRHRPQNSAFW